MQSVGAQLREARLSRGWSPKAAAKATKIKEQQILQLENEEYEKFAAPAYVRGFVQIYARTLGLDEAATLAELEKVLAAEGDDVYLAASPVQYSAEGRSRFSFSPRGIGYAVALGLVIALFAAAAVHVFMIAREAKVAHAAAPVPVLEKPVAPPIDAAPAVRRAVLVEGGPPPPPVNVAKKEEPVEEPVAKAEPVAPKAELVAPAVPVAAAAHELVIDADEACWVRVQAIHPDGVKELFTGVLSEDEEKRFTAPRFRVKMAIPAVLNVTYDGNLLKHNPSRVPSELTLPAEQP